jgi:hypothetical protein
VALREGAAGAGLQIALEADGGAFVGEVESYHDFPRSIACRVSAAASVVRVETSGELLRDADIRALGSLTLRRT